MMNLVIPKSTANRIIIPSNSLGNRFLGNSYCEEFLQDYIT
jgi:hypothetical protein